MRTPITPSTPFAYSASVASPLHLDIQIPLVLLGHKELSPRLARGPERHKYRLEVLHSGLIDLVLSSGVKIALWEDTPFEGKLFDDVTEEETHAFEEQKAEWRGAEQERWDAVSQSHNWVIRATPGHPKRTPDSSIPKLSSVEAIGMSSHWRSGDGLLTEWEAQLAFRESLWTLPFTLQRLNLLSSRREDWEGEVRVVMEALSSINTPDKYENSEHTRIRRPLAVLATERCHPHVGLRQASSFSNDSTPWDDYIVQNVLLLMTAFEREVTTLATPEFLLMNRPLTDFLVAREVGKMRRTRRALWKALSQKIDDVGNNADGLESGARIRKQSQFDRKVLEWRGDLAREDKNVLRREALLGEEGMPWWEHLYQAIIEGSADDLVSDITLRTAKMTGRRLALSLSSQGVELTTTKRDHVQPSSPDPKPKPNPDDRPGPKRTSHIHTRKLTVLSIPPSPSPPNPLPQIATLTFPIPLRSLAPEPFLAYTSLLSCLLHFATENDTEHVYDYVCAAKTDGMRAGETGAEGLIRMAEKLNVREKALQVLIEEAKKCTRDRGADSDGGGMLEKEGDPFWKIEGFVQGRYKQGRKIVDGHAVGEYGHGDGKQQVKMGLRYLERYEVLGGFLVPRRVKVLGLLEGQEGLRRAQVGN
ncbi:uncharacterized protein CC84DRAFT_1231828 [Paraphaeosphaeria sporulosa]|uniref:Uncharacterized protein n=1 Tax=Paraphaeosphaeria sporulosa TaxID=1460663 RepID=A0A177BYN3_9PLEO|nr:uncharacterized protein CC84DRAFT_1231828 [Paraphaeosphaeria sporulosa]OAF99536.1 hypothetical protein CC84DRAFT_1231828 [Paraphaeosphaeria sporulosa]